MSYKKIVASICILIVFFIIWGGTFFYNDLFERLCFLRIFPWGYACSTSFESEKNKIYKKSNKTTIIFVGDSRSEMWGAVSIDKLNNYEVLNIAHGGQTSSQVLIQIRDLSLECTGWVVLQVGINDIHLLGAIPEFQDIAIENCMENIKNIVTFFINKNIKVIVTTLFPPSKVPLLRRIIWPEKGMEMIGHVNTFIKDLADANENIFCIDSYALLTAKGGLLKQVYKGNDFYLHVNEEAYFMLSNDIIDIVSTFDKIRDE